MYVMIFLTILHDEKLLVEHKRETFPQIFELMKICISIIRNEQKNMKQIMYIFFVHFLPAMLYRLRLKGLFDMQTILSRECKFLN